MENADPEHCRLLDAILAASPDMFLLLDRELRCIYASPSLLATFGKAAGELRGCRWREIDFAAGYERIDQDLVKTLSDSCPRRGELTSPILGKVFEYRLQHAQYGGEPAAVVHLRDITEQKEIQSAREESYKLFRTVLENIPAVTSIQSLADGRLLYVSPQSKLVLGYTPEELVGRQADELYYSPDDGARVQGIVKQGGEGRNVELRLRRAGGEPVWVKSSIKALSYGGGPAALVAWYDIDGWKQAEAQRRRTGELLHAIIDNIPVMITAYGEHGEIELANSELERLTGWSAEEVEDIHGLLGKIYPSPEAREEATLHLREGTGWKDLRFMNRNDQELESSWAGVRLSDGTRLGIGIDITERKRVEREAIRAKEMEARLHYKANYDALTGLPNRNLFYERAQHALVKARREGKLVAFLFLDLDGFKAINDNHGHAAGDQLLSHAARRLIRHVRESDTVARLGGDEFLILLEGLAIPEHAAVVAQQIIEAMAEPITVDGREVGVTSSIGIALYPLHGDDVNTLLVHSDHAMYKAKSAGKNAFRFYRRDFRPAAGDDSPSLRV